MRTRCATCINSKGAESGSLGAGLEVVYGEFFLGWFGRLGALEACGPLGADLRAGVMVLWARSAWSECRAEI